MHNSHYTLLVEQEYMNLIDNHKKVEEMTYKIIEKLLG